MGDLIREAWDQGWRNRDTRPIYEKAGEVIELQPPLTRTGKFNIQVSRHFIGPFDALQNHRVRQVNYMAPPREGKTLIADIWLWDLIRNSPGPFRAVFQDEKMAEDHETIRTKRILASDPVIRPFIPERGRIENLLGMDVILDGPAMGNLQGRGYQFMFLDEVWLWMAGRILEAKARQEDFARLQNQKLLIISQGGEAGGEWDAEFNAGLIHEWHVQCQECGKHFEPAWNGSREDGSFWGMIWDKKKDARGFWDIPKAVPTARYVCPFCAGVHIDTARLKSNWNLTGKYVAENSDKSDLRLSFRSSGLISKNHFEMVEMYLNASNQLKMGNPTAMIKFHQKQLALMANEQTVFRAASGFARAKYKFESKWELEDCRLMAIDCQQEGVYPWLIVSASGRARQARRIATGIAYSEAELVKVQKEHEVADNHTLIDTGFRPKGPGGAYMMIIRNGWIGTKGVGTVGNKTMVEGFWHSVEVQEGGKTRNIRVLRTYSEAGQGDPEVAGVEDRAPFIRFSSDQIADTLDGLISSGFWIEPPDDGSEEEKKYRAEMTAEFKVIDGKRTKRMCNECNDRYDCAKGITLGMILTECIPDPHDNRTASQKDAERPRDKAL